MTASRERRSVPGFTSASMRAAPARTPKPASIDATLAVWAPPKRESAVSMTRAAFGDAERESASAATRATRSDGSRSAVPSVTTGVLTLSTPSAWAPKARQPGERERR